MANDGVAAISSASSSDRAVLRYGPLNVSVLLKMMLTRFGSVLLSMESYVFLPIMIGCPVVSALNRFISSGMHQGIVP